MTITRRMPRINDVLLPVLRDELADDWPELQVTSWIPNIDFRSYPLLNVRRIGGAPVDVDLFDHPVVEIAALSGPDLPTCEKLLLDARQVIWEMVRDQRVVNGVGYLHSYSEQLGPTQLESPADDIWRYQMTVSLGLRPTRERSA